MLIRALCAHASFGNDLQYDFVHALKKEMPHLFVELNGAVTSVAQIKVDFLLCLVDWRGSFYAD
jgi:tRNA-dihydrouridine synthase